MIILEKLLSLGGFAMENELSAKKNNKLKTAYPTPHINAAPEDFAKTVLMPGDPLRSEFIAKKIS